MGQAGLVIGLWGTEPRLCREGHSHVLGLAGLGVGLSQWQLCRAKADNLRRDLMSYYSDTANIPPTQHIGRGKAQGTFLHSFPDVPHHYSKEIPHSARHQTCTRENA